MSPCFVDRMMIIILFCPCDSVGDSNVFYVTNNDHHGYYDNDGLYMVLGVAVIIDYQVCLLPYLRSTSLSLRTIIITEYII